MFRLPGLYRIGRPLAFACNTTAPLKSSLFLKPSAVFSKPTSLLSQLRSYRSLTWKRYNRHYNLNKINWQRLAKPALFTGVFCVATTVGIPFLFLLPPFSSIYRYPKTVLYSIIAINVAGFLAWRIPAASRFMTRYGLLLKDNVYSSWTLLGSAFSHQDGFHILFNMMMLYSFGSSLCVFLGPANFLVMYLNSAVISSFFSLLVPAALRSSLAVGSLGASGAIMSVFGTFAYLFPRASIGFFFIPIPGGAWAVFLASIAVNAAGIVLKWSRYDFSAHLGGCVAGFAYGWWYDKLRKEKRRASYRLN
ncbi:CIC11C00000003261 [Sungouiella intermedia]|uniref:CIC11C00000003261 n=1 Tax=Sungouiella intermedia TaxID=45354 RepID=A0A1L0BXT0_9ASCO|nr:CIC11C00000003261 [[Candida] intermedia]